MFRGLGFYAAAVTAGAIGGIAPPADLETTDTYTFAGVADGTLLRNVPGWTNYNSTGATTSQNTGNITGQQLRITGGDTAGKGAQLFAVEQAGATAGQSIEFTIAAGTTYVVAVNSIDNDNMLYLQQSGASLWNIGKIVAGVITNIADTTSWTAVIGDRVRFFQSNRRLSVWRIRSNGIIDIILNQVSIDTGSTPILGLRAGRTSFSSGSTFLDDIVIKTLKGAIVTMTQPLFRSSDFNNLGKAASDYIGANDYPVTGTYSVSNGLTTVPTGFQYKIRDLATGTLLVDWTDCTDFTAPSGVNVTSKFAIPATYSDCQVVYRMRNNISVEFTPVIGGGAILTNTVACGFCWSPWGQSLAGIISGVGTANALTDPYRSNKIYNYVRQMESLTATPAWAKSDNRSTACAATRVISDALGGMCGGMAGGGLAARAQVNLWPGTTSTSADLYNGSALINNWTYYKNTLAAAGALGRVMYSVWEQGQAEGDATALMDAPAITAYKDRLIAPGGFVPEARAQIAGGRNIVVAIDMTGRGTGAPTGSQNFNWPIVRKAQKEAVLGGGADVILGTHEVGVSMSDNLHPDTAGALAMTYRIGLSWVKQALGTMWKGSGPEVLSGSRSGAVITLPVMANGATSYEALSHVDGITAGNLSALTGFRVSADNFTTTLPITSAALVGSDIVVTLTSDPGAGALQVDDYFGKNPAGTSRIFGVYPSGQKIGMEPIAVPLTIA